MAEIVEKVRAAYDRVKDFPENRPDGMIRLLELRALIPELLLYVDRLERERAEWVEIKRLKLGPSSDS